MKDIFKGLGWQHAVLGLVIALVAIKYRAKIIELVSMVPVVGPTVTRLVAA